MKDFKFVGFYWCSVIYVFSCEFYFFFTFFPFFETRVFTMNIVKLGFLSFLGRDRVWIGLSKFYVFLLFI